jgi:hypothetical protein
LDVTAKLDLMELGTRYEHYMELRDAFDEGILMMQNALRIDDNKKTNERISNLKITVALIEARINYLADAETKLKNYGELARTIRAIPPNRPAQIAEVSESTRRECEAEMEQARETGYAEDSRTKDSQGNQDPSTEDTK